MIDYDKKIAGTLRNATARYTAMMEDAFGMLGDEMLGCTTNSQGGRGVTASGLLENMREAERQVSEVRSRVIQPLLHIMVNSVIPSITMKQFRFPKTKRKRVAKKWGKDLRNFKPVPMNDIFVIGDTAHCSPRVYGMIKDALPL
jgi:hypothetical protein